MTAGAVRRTNPQLVFVAVAVCINLIVMFLARHIDDSRAHAVAVGAVLDMTITVPGAYYFLVVRTGNGNLGNLAFIGLLSLWRAAFAFPAIIPGKVWIGAAVECLAAAAILVGVRHARRVRDSDPVSVISEAARVIMPFGFASYAIAGELTVLYYGLAWRARPHIEEGGRAFTLHRRSGFQDPLLTVGLGSLLEILPVHLVLRQWSLTLAWIATGLSFYGAFWALAVSRSLALRPTLVSGTEIRLRFGLLAELRIPVSAIRAVTEIIPGNAVTLPRRTPPELYIEFTRPLELRKLMGLRKSLSGIAVSTDQGPEFTAALRRVGALS